MSGFFPCGEDVQNSSAQVIRPDRPPRPQSTWRPRLPLGISTLPTPIPPRSARPPQPPDRDARPGTCPHPRTPGAKPRGDCPGRSDCQNRRAAVPGIGAPCSGGRSGRGEAARTGGLEQTRVHEARCHRHYVDARGARAALGVRYAPMTWSTPGARTGAGLRAEWQEMPEGVCTVTYLNPGPENLRPQLGARLRRRSRPDAPLTRPVLWW